MLTTSIKYTFDGKQADCISLSNHVFHVHPFTSSSGAVGCSVSCSRPSLGVNYQILLCFCLLFPICKLLFFLYYFS